MLHRVYCKINEYRANFRLLPEFLNSHSTQNRTDSFVLQRLFGEAHPIISEHLQCLPRAKKKLPSLFDAGCLFAKIPYEQSTAENVARFHGMLAGKGEILSLTGGFGSDDIAFARVGARVTSLDPDPCLNALVAYNLEMLELEQIQRISSSAEAYLAINKTSFDLVFADPDRRPDGERKHGNVTQYAPDVFALIEQYPNLAPRWLVKLSPLSDIAWLQKRLASPMDIHVVTENGEVKEVLCDIHPKAQNKILLQQVNDEHIQAWDGLAVPYETSDFPIFMEASAATIKCGFHRQLTKHFPLTSLNKNQTYFTGNSILPEFVSRHFRLVETIHGSLSAMQSRLKEMGISQANISSREFVIGSEALREKTGLKDGGNTYLFFTGKQEKTCFVCEKI